MRFFKIFLVSFLLLSCACNRIFLNPPTGQKANENSAPIAQPLSILRTSVSEVANGISIQFVTDPEATPSAVFIKTFTDSSLSIPLGVYCGEPSQCQPLVSNAGVLSVVLSTKREVDLLRTVGLTVSFGQGSIPSSSSPLLVTANGVEKRMRYLYSEMFYALDSSPGDLSSVDLQNLDLLAQNGMNTLLIDIRDSTDLASLSAWISTIKGNATLSKFKYIMATSAIAKSYCASLDCSSPVTALPSGLVQTYDTILAATRADPTLFAGYYTFDEPSYHGFHHTYQELAYNYIRSRDSASLTHPIIVANTLGGTCSQSVMQATLSIQSQDVEFIDEYNVSEWAADFSCWKQSGQLVSFVLVLPAFIGYSLPDYLTSGTNISKNGSICVDPSFTGTNAALDHFNYGESLLAAISKAGIDPSLQGGYAYFSYWLRDKTSFGFELAADNCPLILDSVVSHLKAAASGQ